MKSGIYTITSPSGKRYVGSAMDYSMRKGGHLYHLRRGRHHSPALQAAYAKYGEDGLVFEKIICCAPTYLIELEQLMIDTLNPEYNINKIAGSRLGMRHSDEAKAKISAAGKREMSADHRRKLSEARKGMVFTDEHRANISRATKGKTKRQPAGQTRSPERRASIAAKLKGVPKSPEARANMLAARRARMIRDNNSHRGPRGPQRRTVLAHIAMLEWILDPSSYKVAA